MAAKLEDLIDLNLLSHYDGKIKTWVQNKISNTTSFTPDAELPAVGEVGVLYITEGTIKYWDDTQQKYVDVGGGSGSSETIGTWGSFG